MIVLTSTPIDPDKVLVEISSGILGDTPVGLGTITRLAHDESVATVAFSLTHGAHSTAGEVTVPAALWDHIRELMDSDNA